MRLTKKEKQIDCDYIAYVEYLGIVEKLGQLEDIEEELGIDLITFVKAQLNGVWFKSNEIEKEEEFSVEYKVKHLPVRFIASEKCFALIDENNCQCGDLRFRNYGKTWALTKEELE